MSNIRLNLEQLMDATVKDASHWHYNDGRPESVEKSWQAGQHVESDCSKGVQKLCRWAGVPASLDPMGMWSGPYGNSATLCVHLVHKSKAGDLDVGDIITFGPGGDQHAAMVRRKHAVNPLLWSDGHQGAPNFYHLFDDHREHQFLRLAVGPLVVTHEDELRAMTGYWAWVAWNYGEGAWLHYGPRNKNVRPHVPATIPDDWLAKLKKFDADRHKGNAPKGAK